MTPSQEDVLLVEWRLYGPSQQRAMIEEFLTMFPNQHSESDFFAFLREKLEIDGYWDKVGLG